MPEHEAPFFFVFPDNYGARRVFHTRTGGTLVAGDRAAQLARLAGLQPDPTAVAVHLLGMAPAPLDQRPLWSAVTVVPPGTALLTRPDGVPSHRRWHRPPEPDTPMDRGAAAVREALLDAVDVRTAPGGLISSDLSGGLDSTTALVASRRRVTVLAARMAARGSRLHLTGNGRDNLFVGLPHHLHALVARHPLLALRRLGGFRALLSWPLAPVARQLADRRGYRAALTCRLGGSWPTWCVGTLMSPPFSPHAWVEAEGGPIGEKGGHDRWARLVSVAAPTSVTGSRAASSSR
ncbi:lasso peptide biosynthesis B2 protein [Streptomyces sp. NBC_00503]|uniref:lasso peptide biosynthesis B2 protein n=1 Tax=Streptomyces sp. NBC_00503 TaxID=2903659 RepID=UPI002E80BAAC|nr:lasso peptide biosynthesis B2 protein [Streptomyces sp. NBC_00503]WUD86319.1 lasso peptide biosynthesis B2 protein [Streptomyces sp. NBC_00503]